MGCGCNSSCDCSQVITIPNGGIGPTGPQGPPGNDGADGADGTNGTNGTNGTDGADGAAATIAVGTVTTGAPGSSVTVTNSGTSSAATFDFSIPEGAPGAGVTVTTVTYAELISLIGSSGLTPGGLYRMAYQTKHLIGGTSDYNYNTTTYDSGTGVSTTFTPATENLLIRAVTANKIDIRVISESYPRDIIYYDHTLDTTEDGVAARSGFITYRENPDDDISAPYDFRNVLHRRYIMDTTSTSRDTEFKAALGDVSTSSSNHESGSGTYQLTIPPFVAQISGSNATIGIYDTARVGTHKDFKTFVGYDDELWFVTGVATKEKPRFKNVHLKASDKVARIKGSASGQTIETDEGSGGGTEGQLYPALTNVVIFSRGAENITIGQNAAGITITGRTNSNITIGNNNENINIGGKATVLDYTQPTEPKTLGWNENISIGNNNRNIMISDQNKGVKIGNSNIAILINYYCHNVTIGSYNSNIYHHSVHDSYIEDWSQTIRISQSNNLKIESKSTVIDIIKSQMAPGSAAPIGGLTKDIPVGYQDTASVSSESSGIIEIKARCNNICLSASAGIIIGSSSENIFTYQCHNITIADNCSKIDMHIAYWINIGIGCSFLEITSSFHLDIGGSTLKSKILTSAYIEIGAYCEAVLVMAGSTDVKIGNNCNSILTKGVSLEIENTTDTVYLWNCEAFKIGERSHDIYANKANNCSVGADCDDVVFNNLNITEKPTHLGDQHLYSYTIGDTRISNGTGSTYVASQNPFNSTESGEDLVTLLNAGGYAAPQSDIVDNHVGNDCNDVYIINSKGNTVGNNCAQIRFGNSVVANYSLVYTAGVANPTGSSPARNAANITGIAGYSIAGNDCSYNTVGNNCATIHLIGANKTHNIFGNNINSVIAPAARVFASNRVLVDGGAVTTTVDHENRVFNFKDTDASAGRWAHTVNPTTGTANPIGATAQIDVNGAGTVTACTYNSVSIIDTALSITGSTVAETAINLANAINTYTSVPNYTATVNSATGIVYVTLDPAEGASLNSGGYSASITGTATTVVSVLGGGVDSGIVKLI